LEERFDKHLIEHNRLREGLIFKLDKKFSPYRESKMLASPQNREQLYRIQRMWQEVMAGSLSPDKFFDLEKMAKLFVICDLMNNKHPVALQNIRFYFNPVTGLVEPIAREWENLDKNDVADLSLWLEQPKRGTRHYRLKQDYILSIIYDNIEFKKHYLKEAERLCQKDFLDSLFDKKKEEIDLLLNKIYRTWPYYIAPYEKLYQNQEYMRSVLFNNPGLITSKIKKRNGNNIELQVQNKQNVPLELSRLSFRDSVFLFPEEPIILEPNSEPNESIFKFNIPPNISWSDNYLKELKLHYNILGLAQKENTIRIYPPDNAEFQSI
jgi:hypothetical protein